MPPSHDCHDNPRFSSSSGVLVDKPPYSAYRPSIDHSYPSALINPGLDSGNVGEDKVNILFWNVEGKNRFINALGDKYLDKDALIAGQDILFLSETWSVVPFSSRKLFNFSFSSAVKTQGRPSGGLEFYSSPSRTQKVISQSPHHICIVSSNFQVIGVYYKPSLEFDDLILDLVKALDACCDDIPIVLGGDFNLHYGTPDFRNLAELLEIFNISLVSDPSRISFDGVQGSSTPDHVFISTSPRISGVNVRTVPRPQSSHFPICVELSLNSVNTEAEKAEVFPESRLDVELCKTKLIPILSNLDITSPEVLADQICTTFSESRTIPPHHPRNRKNTFEIDKLIKETDESFELFQRYRTPFFKEVHFRCRRSLQAAVRRNNAAVKESLVAKLISDTRSNGIRALYRPAKKFAPSSSAVTLREWFDFFSNLYQSFNEPNLKHFQFPPTEEASHLCEDFSADEVKFALDHQSSGAVGFSGISPINLKAMSDLLAPILAKIFSSLLNGNHIPLSWLTSVFFFIHKKGSMDDPNNYRSLAIEDPFLKVLTTALTFRLSSFAESSGILPDFQFGFRKSLSTTSAVAILTECIKNAFNNKKRVYACFVDYKKAFDLVNRDKLLVKMQGLGIPFQICRLIYDILSGLRMRVRSNDMVSPPFPSFNGVPQGDPLSPLLYSLFTADLPSNLHQDGVELGQRGMFIKYILYADDLVLLAHDPSSLQGAVNSLSLYADKNDLVVNTSKTKCMVFHRGYCPQFSCIFKGTEIEVCNSFTYLGVVLTTQLASGQHVKHVISKCNQRIGYLFAKLPLREVPMAVVIDIFNTYVLPIALYALPIWYPNLREDGKKSLNAVFTKFLKRYLGLPWGTRNGLVHYVTGTSPMCHYLQSNVSKYFYNLVYPSCMNGVLLTPPPQSSSTYCSVEHVPSYFWMSRVISYPLPNNFEVRRALLYDSFDLHHHRLCPRKEHHTPSALCVCNFCGYKVERYHYRMCPAVMFETSCGRLKFLAESRNHNEV